MIHVDTHVIVWLFNGNFDRFGPNAQHLMRAHEIYISPMVLVELDYLKEIGRATKHSGEVLAELVSRIQLRVSDAPWSVAAVEARTLSFTSDPFDRLICATAKVDGCKLLTADQTLLDNFDQAVWE